MSQWVSTDSVSVKENMKSVVNNWKSVSSSYKVIHVLRMCQTEHALYALYALSVELDRKEESYV